MEKPKGVTRETRQSAERPLGDPGSRDDAAKAALKGQMAKDTDAAKSAAAKDAKAEAKEVTCGICGEPGLEGAEHPATDEHGIHNVTEAKASGPPDSAAPAAPQTADPVQVQEKPES